MQSRHLDNQLRGHGRCEGSPVRVAPARCHHQSHEHSLAPTATATKPDQNYLVAGLTCPVSAGLGGKAGHGPSFTWKASSAIAREDFSSTFIGIIKPPAQQSQEYVGAGAQENQIVLSVSISAMHSASTATVTEKRIPGIGKYSG
jgi:hypothetical protein